MRDVVALVKVIQQIEVILCEHIEEPRAVTDPEGTIGRIFEMMDRYDAVGAADRIEAGYGLRVVK